jgi:transcriptional antiterminator RfaH
MLIGTPFTDCQAQDAGATAGWFAVKTHVKQEHIAAAHLRQDSNIQVFLPRIRFKRRTQFGLAWVTEALFQTYLFACFDVATRLRRVQHSRAVRGVVHFGTRWPTIPENVIEELRRAMGEKDVSEISNQPEVGEAVRIAVGPLCGLEAVVTRIMPGPQRVAVLLDFLGRQAAVELGCDQVLRQEMPLHPACLA